MGGPISIVTCVVFADAGWAWLVLGGSCGSNMASRARAARIAPVAAGKGNFGKDLFGVQLEVRISLHQRRDLNFIACTIDTVARASSKSQAPFVYTVQLEI